MSCQNVVRLQNERLRAFAAPPPNGGTHQIEIYFDPSHFPLTPSRGATEQD